MANVASLWKSLILNSQSKPTLYLHIGTWKTGTTALQKFLVKNAELLQTENIFYPDIGRFGRGDGRAIAHHKFAWTFGYGNDLYMRPGDPAPWIQLVDEKWPKDSVVIISSESLYSAVLNYHSSVKIRDWLSGFNLKIVVYYRPQEELIESGYKNQVKLGKVKEDIYSYAKKNRYYYHNQLAHITKVFGKRNVLVRPYCKKTLVNEDICSDFLYLIGKQTIPGLVAIDEMSNRSLSEHLLRFLLEANQLNTSPKFKENFNLYLKSLVEESKAIISLSPSFQLVSSEWRNQVRAQYRNSNKKLVKNHSPDFKQFLSEYTNDHNSKSNNKPQREDAYALYKLLVEKLGEKVCPMDRFVSYKSLVKKAVESYKRHEAVNK